MTTSRQGSAASDFVGGLQDAIQKNPMSAALIGMGVLWMFAGGKNITAAAALFPAAAKATAAGAASGVQRSAEIAGGAGEAVRSFGSNVVDGVRDAVSSAAASASETATKTYEAVKDTAADSGSHLSHITAGMSGTGGLAWSLQQNLTNTFERQPLLLGAIGLAIGAGMAAAVPTTQMETEMVGDTANRVKAQAAELATTTVDKVTETAERTFEAVKQEAAAQGLTPQAARAGAAAVGAKLKTVAKTARDQTAKAKST